MRKKAAVAQLEILSHPLYEGREKVHKNTTSTKMLKSLGGNCNPELSKYNAFPVNNSKEQETYF
jgi:hypothetical protein